MYAIALIVIIILLFIVALTSKCPSNVFISFGLIDIFLRIINYIGEHTISVINDIINKIFPNSIPAIIDHYSNGILTDILMWCYLLLMIVFFFHVFKILIKRY